MTAPTCPRERDVIAAIVAGSRPVVLDDELRAHSAQCDVCKDLVEVVELMHLDREAFQEDVNVPGAGQIWWRAAIRARLEASQQAAQPLSWLFGVSVACVVGLVIAVVELLWSPVQIALRSASPTTWTVSTALGDLMRWFASLSEFTPLTTTAVFVLLGAAACLLLAPLALYFALSDE